jgi:hypothetical protein
MSDPDRKPGVDLSWMPATSAEEWQRELDALCAVRLMLAGLGLRHAIDREAGVHNVGLDADIAAIQATLQQEIDRAVETVAALRDLVKAMEGRPHAPAPETLH